MQVRVDDVLNLSIGIRDQGGVNQRLKKEVELVGFGD